MKCIRIATDVCVCPTHFYEQQRDARPRMGQTLANHPTIQRQRWTGATRSQAASVPMRQHVVSRQVCPGATPSSVPKNDSPLLVSSLDSLTHSLTRLEPIGSQKGVRGTAFIGLPPPNQPTNQPTTTTTPSPGEQWGSACGSCCVPCMEKKSTKWMDGNTRSYGS